MVRDSRNVDQSNSTEVGFPRLDIESRAQRQLDVIPGHERMRKVQEELLFQYICPDVLSHS
jgi:hypothetical protein